MVFLFKNPMVGTEAVSDVLPLVSSRAHGQNCRATMVLSPLGKSQPQENKRGMDTQTLFLFKSVNPVAKRLI